MAEPYNAFVWSYVVLLQLNADKQGSESTKNSRAECYRFVIDYFLFGNLFLFYIALYKRAWALYDHLFLCNAF